MKPLSHTELLDLFKHWDTRVSHQEMLYVTLASAPLAAVATAWNDIDAQAIFVLALASIAVYLFNLFSIRRFAAFQDNIFNKLKAEHLEDWDALVANGQGHLGVRRLRLLGLPALSLIWTAMVVAKRGIHLPLIWQALLTMLVVVAILFSAWLWGETPSTN